MIEEPVADKNIALDLVRVTEAAALSASRYIGCGDSTLVDKSAVDAMRVAFQNMHIKGSILLEKSERVPLPMLYKGEKVGFGDGYDFDIALSPVDGINNVANGEPNGISAVGMAPKGKMFDSGHSLYCEKIVVGPKAASCVDLNAPLEDNLYAVAHALDKEVSQLNVFVLKRERHLPLIKRIHALGARVILRSDGDITGTILTLDPRSEVDMLIGIGGTPESVISACLVKGCGGELMMRLCPQSGEEKEAVVRDGLNLKEVLAINDIIKSDECFFAATGISGGDILKAVHFFKDYALTSSLSSRGRTGTRRYIETWHDNSKLSKMQILSKD